MEDKLSLVLQTPLEFNGIMIYQPTLQDIIDYGFDKYNELLFPFLLSKDAIDLDKKQYADFDVFDIFFLSADLQIKLLNSLSYFCKTDEIAITEKQEIKIGKGRLFKNNFNAFADVILKINARTRPNVEKHNVVMNEKTRDIMEKLHKGRERQQKKNQLYLYDMIKVVEIGGKTYISISEIKKMTMWKILDIYSSILYKDGYEQSFDVFLISGDKNLIQKHWSEQIKIQ